VNVLARLLRPRISRPWTPALLVLLIAACNEAGSGGPTAAPQTPPPGVTATPRPTAAPAATPTVTTVDGLTVTTISLGVSAAPIDVVSAFGSMWVALHHQGAVSRLDPVTLMETARIKVGSGPGWFAVTDDAVWVSSQMGHGLTRIDPATNAGDVQVGQWATCGGPLLALGSLWQAACDARQIMRIDPVQNTVIDITAGDAIGVGLVGEDMIAVGPTSLARIDLDTNKLQPIGPGAEGFPVLFDDTSVWMAGANDITRISIEDGKVLGTIPLGGETAMTASGTDAWVSQFGVAASQVDLATGKIVRTVHLDKPSVAREIGGVVWFTSFDRNSLGWFKP
jgi:hypothetical protein